MKWYVAHAVMWLRFKDGTQDYVPIEENLLLISAATGDEALAKAGKVAQERYGGDDSNSLRCDGRPAERVFGGIRRLIECEDSDQQPSDGTEVTYQFLVVESKKELDALLADRDVVVTLSGDTEPSKA
jgi:Domain of unknown function (DUF4288)